MTDALVPDEREGQMDAPTTKSLTPARSVALAVIALLALGLAYLRLAPGPEPVSVPAGAQAGDLVTEPCTYPTEDGGYDADCGTLVVPENRADSDSRLIALPVVRVRARSGDPGPPVFWLEGGPGQSNMEFDYTSRFARDRDFIFVGYRGIDGSVRLDCPEVSSALKRSGDFLSQESFRAYGAAYQACADRLADEGVDLPSYGLVQQVDDMEAARVALGYDHINLLSQSAGTRTAMIYAWRYPERIHRSVMVAVNPPGNFLWDPVATDELVGRYAELCAADDGCRRRTDDLAASLRQTATDVPGRWLLWPIKDANVRISTLYGLMETTSNAFPSSAAATLDSLLSAAEGDASGLWFSSVLADLLYTDLFVWGQYAAAASIDAHAARDYFSAGDPDYANYGYAPTAFGWGGGLLADGWPTAREVDEYRSVQTSQVETLLVTGELDFATPPQIATEQLLPYLPNGHEVVLPEFGHVASVWTEQPEAGTTLISTFFDTGVVDDALYRPQPVEFIPSVRHPTLAKLALGLMITLGALSVGSLVGMARRVGRRGRFGPVSGALLRSLYPVVLGVGGWFLGVLLVLVTLPAVTIDNELLAVLAAGSPIGLGIYLAWVHRDWAVLARRVGFAAALAGALAGGWLGFNVTGGFTALATTVAGAVAGANLVLIVLDVARARAARPLTTSQDVSPVRAPAHT